MKVVAVIFTLVAAGSATIAQTQAPKGCPADPPPILKQEWQGSALPKAVMDRKPELVEKLLSQGASPDEKDNWGNPPLINALTPFRRTEPAGIVPPKEQQALIAAENHAQIAIATSLMNHHADLNAKAPNGGTTPLMLLITHGYGMAANLKLIRLMIAHKANLNLQDDSGDTALLIATRLGNSQVAKLLLNNNADPNLANCRGETPLKIAQNSPDHELISLFSSYKPKVN